MGAPTAKHDQRFSLPAGCRPHMGYMRPKLRLAPWSTPPARRVAVCSGRPAARRLQLGQLAQRGSRDARSAASQRLPLRRASTVASTVCATIIRDPRNPFDRLHDEGDRVKRKLTDSASARFDVTLDVNVIVGTKGRCGRQRLIACDTDNPCNAARSVRLDERRSDSECQFIWRCGPRATKPAGDGKCERAVSWRSRAPTRHDLCRSSLRSLIVALSSR
jgi:hypothetical protein